MQRSRQLGQRQPEARFQSRCGPDADQIRDHGVGEAEKPLGNHCLPTVLFGAGYRIRTDDLLFTREMLYQLS